MSLGKPKNVILHSLLVLEMWHFCYFEKGHDFSYIQKLLLLILETLNFVFEVNIKAFLNKNPPDNTRKALVDNVSRGMK